MPDQDDPTQPPSLPQQLLDIINASWMTQATYVAARLKLPDLLDSGPKSAADLATATECNPYALRQLLRALCSLDVCRETDDALFEITPMGRLLSTQSPQSLRSWALHWGGSATPIWSDLLGSVKTGLGTRERRTGQPGFEHLEKDPQTALIFNQAMVELTRLMAATAARTYDFAGKRIADIGGGYGELLAAILETYPDATGILFDMDHAIAKARERLATRGIAARCDLVTGNFFESIPPGAGIYLLKSVIHDWNDQRARQILHNCRNVMSPASRLLLLERIVPTRMEATREHRALARSDLNMLVAFGAHERSEAEFIDLLRSAGFEVNQVRPAGSDYFWVEAVPS